MSTNFYVNWPSVWRGLRAMKRQHGLVIYQCDFTCRNRGFWLHAWTPKWHEGRGPYFTCGLGFIRLMRGY